MSGRRWPAFDASAFENPRLSQSSLLTTSPVSPPPESDFKKANWVEITQDLVEQNRLLEDECRLLEDQFRKLAVRANSLEAEDVDPDQRSRADHGNGLTDMLASIIQEQNEQLEERMLTTHIEEAHEHLDHVIANFDEASAVATAASGHVTSLESRCEQLRVEAEVACRERDIEMQVGACLRDELRECKDLANAGRSVRLASQQEEDEQVHETSMQRMSKVSAFGPTLSLADELDGITSMAVGAPEVPGQSPDDEAKELRLNLRALQAELSRTRFEHESALRTASVANTEILAARAEATAARSELGKVATLEAQLKDKEKETTELKKKLNERGEVSNSEVVAARSQATVVATLEMQLKDKHEESAELKLARETFLKERDEASTELAQAQKQYRNVCVDLNSLQRNFGEAQRELAELRAGSIRAGGRKSEMEEFRELEAKHRKACAEVDKFRMEFSHAREELAELKVQNNHELDVLRHKCGVHDGQFNDWPDDVSSPSIASTGTRESATTPETSNKSSPSSGVMVALAAAKMRKKKSEKSSRTNTTPVPRRLESYYSETAEDEQTSLSETGDEEGGWSLLGYVGWGGSEERLDSITEEDREDQAGDGKTSRACMSPQAVGITLAAGARARNRVRQRKAVVDDGGAEKLQEKQGEKARAERVDDGGTEKLKEKQREKARAEQIDDGAAEKLLEMQTEKARAEQSQKMQKQKAAKQITVTFEPGGVGLTVREGTVTKIAKGKQGEQVGVQLGWRLVAINGQECNSFESQLFVDAKNSNAPYQVTFLKAKATALASPEVKAA